ncbi:unnamed protein product [Symbiodinium sp. CCMP2592]|nr:unnamed protein product [Symbiodinium sp. CCMP2592]
MGAYYASSLKRQFAYANSPAIRRLDRGQLQVTRARLQSSDRTVKTRRSYTNKSGKLCYQGTKELKATEKYPVLFGLAIAKIFEELKALQAELAILDKKPIRMASISTLSLDSREVDEPPTPVPPPAIPAVAPPPESGGVPAVTEPSLLSKSEEEDEEEQEEQEEEQGEEMLKNAAKQRIRRMVKPKAKRSDLVVPAWVAEQWNKGTSQKEAMAALLQEVNWDKTSFLNELEKVVKRTREIEIVKDQGWYSQSEMKTDLKWQRITAAVAHCEKNPSLLIRRNVYDGVLEYWVTVRETGRHVENLKEEEIQRSRSEAANPVELPKDAFAGFDNMTKRVLPEPAGPDGSGDAKKSEGEELNKNYSKATEMTEFEPQYVALNIEARASRHVKALEDGITKLEKEHDKLNLHWAQAASPKVAVAKAKAKEVLQAQLCEDGSRTSVMGFRPMACSVSYEDADEELWDLLTCHRSATGKRWSVSVDEPGIYLESTLPVRARTAGGVLRHAIKTIDSLQTRLSPMLFKIGMTHDAVRRWECPEYGYVFERDHWEGVPGCRNIRLGGDNLSKDDALPAVHMTYVVYRSLKHKPCDAAPVTSAIRAARAVLEEVPEAVGSSIRIMAGCKENNSERDAHRVARRCRLTLPIMITEVMLHGWPVPLNLLSAWLTFLLGRNLLHTLSGLTHPDLTRCHSTWKCFWARYQKIHPHHDIFRRAAAGEVDLSRTVGLILHGDEGRTKKKSAILVLSCHSILGYGSNVAADAHPEPFCKQYLNLTRHTLSTRWILGCLPKTYYECEDGDRFFQDYLDVFVQDFLQIYEKGIKAVTGEVYHFVILNVIGDWPWLTKAFGLLRNFQNCSKQESSKAAPKGICHCCKADMENYPFEDFVSASPAWRETINQERAYRGSPSFWSLPKDPTDETAFLGQDIFHGFHLGAAKQFLASCLLAGLVQQTTRPRAGAKDPRRHVFCAGFLVRVLGMHI